MAPLVVSLRCERLDAVGGESDIARTSRAGRFGATGPQETWLSETRAVFSAFTLERNGAHRFLAGPDSTHDLWRAEY
jgi:hypothetical protein